MEKLLCVNDLTVNYMDSDGVKCIVKDVSFDIYKGEIFGIIGESGCGKTTVASSIVDLLPDNFQICSGTIRYMGKNLVNLSSKEYLEYLGRKIGFIFQDPMESLNPLLNIGIQISEKLLIHNKLKKDEIKQRVVDIMREVGLADAEFLMDKYPHELSGGMRQRVMIAMAVINRPQLIIADEPTTALDPTIQAQILQLLKKIAQKYECSILVISHNFGVINQICDKVAVMYSGEIVEQTDVKNIFKNPLHPYTKGLIKCLPDPAKKGQKIISIPGMVEYNNKKDCCVFYNRCDKKNDNCVEKHPDMYKINTNHCVRCFRFES